MAEELRYKFTGDGGQLGRTLDDTARKADKAGDSLDDLADDARRLDAEIADLRESMRETAVAIARAADEAERKNLFKVLRQQKRDLGQRVKVRDLIDIDDGDARRMGARMAAALGEGVSQAGGPIADALGNVFGVLPPQAQAAIGAGVVGAVAVAAPAIGAVVSGAVTAGVGAAGVAAGIALASRDARVKAAADGLGTEIMDALSEAAAPAFVPPVLTAIGRIRTEVRELDDELEGVFGAAARHVDPFVDGLIGAGKAALPGFTEGLRNAGPVARALADGMTELGDAVGDSVAMMSEASVGGAHALRDLFTVVSVGLRGVSAMVTGLTWIYEGVKFVTSGFMAQRRMLIEHAAAAGEAENPLQRLAGAFQEIAEEQTEAANAGRDVMQVWDDLFGSTMSADQALLRYEESWDRLIAELNEGKKTLDIGSQAGRENTAAILEQVNAVNDLYKAGLITDAQYQQQLATITAAAVKRGFEAAAVQAVIDKYRAIPKLVATEMRHNAVPARKQVEDYIRSINAIPTTRSVTIIQNLVAKGVKISGINGPGGVTAFSDGGMVDGPGPVGVDSVPAVLARGEGVLTVDGMRRLGGERVLNALNAGQPVKAAPAAPAPAGTPAGERRPPQAVMDEARWARALVRALSGMTLVLDDRTGRTAELRARGG